MVIELYDPRPDDMAELARLTAIELRKRGIWADTGAKALLPTIVRTQRARFDDIGKHKPYSAGWNLALSQFDNLGPIACADVIQAEEARRAQEWAGDS